MCVPPKCGSSSFRFAVAEHLEDAWRRREIPDIAEEFRRIMRELGLGPFTPEEAAAKGLPMYLAVRHPVDRFGSLWRDIQRPNVKRLDGLQYWTAQQLIALIEKHPLANPHWAPQHLHWVTGVTPVPYMHFLEHVGLPHKWVHRGAPVEAEFPVDRILALYGRDLELWEEAIA